MTSDITVGEVVRNAKGGRCVDLEAALQALPERTMLYLDLRSTRFPGQLTASLAAALDAIKSPSLRQRVIVMAYDFDQQALFRTKGSGILTVLKSSEALPKVDAVTLAMKARSFGCVGICVPVPPASAAANLERALAVRLIAQLWGPFRERRQTIRDPWLAGVPEFITGYGWFRVHRAAMGWRF